MVVGERFSFLNGLTVLEIIINKVQFKDVIKEPAKYCRSVFRANGSEYYDSHIYIGVSTFRGKYFNVQNDHIITRNH